MCSSPDVPPTPDPPPPPEEKKVDLNPERKKSTQVDKKKRGTRSLQIPMGGTQTKSGLNVPK
jgi:hypothetical protein